MGGDAMFERERSSPGHESAAQRVPAGAQRVVRRSNLVVGRADDPAEREADEMAADVLAVLRSGSGATRIRRSAAASRAAEVGAQGGPISDDLATRILRAPGGRPLDANVRPAMENAFDVDLSSVRIHEGSELAAEVAAEAFTVGNRIHFAPGRYDPHSASGQHLLSHELAHVVQQGGAALRRTLDRAPRVQRSPMIIRRNEKSAELLTKLAVPKVGEGPAIDIQKGLVDDLEKVVMGNKAAPYYDKSELNLGGILVDRLPNTGKSLAPAAKEKNERSNEIGVLFTQLEGEGKGSTAPAVEFVGLAVDPQNKATFGAKSAGIAMGADVKKAGLGPKLVQNTLKTMIDAEQFEYLRLAGLPNAEWKILVELHYIRARPKDMAGFHKDTQGQSLFVNLNYHVPDHEVRGPEYVLNPPKSEAHDKLIYGSGETKGTLPEEFTKDLTTTRDVLGAPTKIESSGTVQPFGYVAFVDEAVHHATPWFGNRYITPAEFKGYLERNHKAQLDEIVRADKKFRGSLWPESVYGFATYVDKKIIAEDEIEKWKTWLAMASVGEVGPKAQRYTRLDFAATMKSGEFEHMLEEIGAQPNAARQQAGVGGWYSAQIPKAGLAPVRPTGKPPLTRTASDADLTKTWPKQLPENVPRRFIRSWVRAIPADFAAKLRGT